jgi:hypothetical protein
MIPDAISVEAFFLPQFLERQSLSSLVGVDFLVAGKKV